MHSAFVNQSLSNDEGILPSAYLSSFPHHFAVETDEAEVTYFDWVIVIMGHAMLLFPFPGWLLLYLLFDEVTPLTPILGTVLSVGSIQPGAYLLADAEQNPGERLKHWIFYSAFVSILSIIGLLFTIGPHLLAFVPAVVFVLFLSVGCWGRRRVTFNESEPSSSSIRRGQTSSIKTNSPQTNEEANSPLTSIPLLSPTDKFQMETEKSFNQDEPLNNQGEINVTKF